MGTHNSVVIKSRIKMFILEVIAIDPAPKTPQNPRWFNLDNPIKQQAKLENITSNDWLCDRN